MTPSCAYLVCATPRSGSTLLCHLLGQTGIAGHPEEYFEALRHSGVPRRPHEYFDRERHANIIERLAFREMPDGPMPAANALWRPDRYEQYLEWALSVGTTGNGVFGAKLMWTHLLDLADRLERPADPALLAERLPGLRYVHVTRGDKVAQAVSLWRAVQTLAWRADDAREEGEVVYHGGAIGHLVADLSEQDDAWRAWFAANGIEPLTIAYEALADDATAAVASVLEYVGAGPAEIPEPPLKRQGDDRSARWVERFRAEEAVAP